MPSLPFLGLGTESNLRGLADALPDGLFTTDAEGIVTFWNAAAERITGWSRAEALGQRCSILAGDSVRGCSCGVGPIRCGLALTSRSSKCCTVRTKDGRLVLIVKNAVTLLDSAGRPVGALESFTEVGNAGGPDGASAELPAGAGAGWATGDFAGMVGRHPAMQELYRIIELVARSGSTVMILGESGSGKELVAEAIHRASARAAGPFVRVSCAALSEHQLEAELFGHAKGAFPGAPGERAGRFQEARGGTLLLDEIGDISPAVQVKLLRVIEEREVERVGGAQAFAVDVRLLCATHRDLRQLVTEGRFRADLYFRLATFPLQVPALREHPEDVPLLVDRFLARLAPPTAERPQAIAQDALRALCAHAWPGNVRELQNVLAYASLRAGSGELRLEHLPPELRSPPHGEAGRAAAGPAERERRELVLALERAGWNRARAAAALGVSRVTLWKRMKRHAIAVPASGEQPPRRETRDP